MITPISIAYKFVLRDPPEPFSMEDYPDWPLLDVAMRRLFAAYECWFVVKLGEISLPFERNLHLGTIFERLPATLTALTRDTSSPVFIDFFAQGADLLFILERRGEHVTLRCERGDQSGRLYSVAPIEPLTLRADDFLRAWTRFVRAVLDKLVTLDPTLRDDPGYRSYASAIEQATPT